MQTRAARSPVTPAPWSSDACPLCGSGRVRPFAELQGRHYLDCAQCGLVHLEPGQRLSPEAERQHYGTHRNEPADPRYRAFLDRLAAPLVQRLPGGAEGLDFGSGPGPALAAMLRERGFRVSLYDPFFAPEQAVLRRSYDFVTCTEAVEHFFHPGQEFQRLDRLLRAGGWLGIMTATLRDEIRFQQWRYARDPTHASFYRPRTLDWIAHRFGWDLHTPHPDVALFRKPAGPGGSDLESPP